MGVDPKQFHDFVIEPVLDHIGLNSLAARRLLLGTALQESGLEYIRQLSDGPALGFFQMEPDTHDDCWGNFLQFRKDLADKIMDFMQQYPHGAGQMVGNAWYAAAMCRVKYKRVKYALPKAEDAAAMAAYWKQFYNSPYGAGTVQVALPKFKLAIEVVEM